MKKSYCSFPVPLKYLVLALLFSLYFSHDEVYAQTCDPDTLPPVAICKASLTVALGANDPNDCYGSFGPNNVPPAFGPNEGAGVAFVNATSLNDGSYDACGAGIKFTVQRLPPNFPAWVFELNSTNGHGPCADLIPDFPSEFETAISELETLKLYSRDIGTDVPALLRAYQLTAGGTIATHPVTGAPIVGQCVTMITVEDKQAPTCTPPPSVTVTCEAFDPSLLAYGNATIQDNACLDSTSTVLNYSAFDTVCNKGTIVRLFKAFDCSGNSSLCSQSIVVNYVQSYYVHFPNDLILSTLDPNGYYGEPTFSQEDCELLGVSYEDQFFTNSPTEHIRLNRTWTIINWCTYDPGLPGIHVPNPEPNADINHPSNLPGPIVSAPGTQVPWASSVVKIHSDDPTATDYSSFWEADVNFYQYTQTIRIIDTFFIGVTGKVFSDEQADCNYQPDEPGLPGWSLELTGLTTNTKKTVTTDQDGNYSALFTIQDTLVKVRLLNSINIGQNCPPDYIVHGQIGQMITQNVPAVLNNSCDLLSVSIATPSLRRCFDNRYMVKACNLSAQNVSNVYVDVDLDNYLHYLQSSVTAEDQGYNRYRFQLGDLAAGDCRSFWIDINVGCDAPLGATHCSDAHIYPMDDCRNNSDWSGADVDVSARCDGDSVRLKITNIGDGPMAETLQYVVVEDIIMRQSGPFQLAPAESLELSYAADGSTWRLEAPEEPYHPFQGVQSTALEGCGGFHTLGLVNQFPLASSTPFVDRDCRQNIGALDPNDKQAFPGGFGADHLLKANSDIEYLIRFQNTGTDTALNVVVLDTLSQYLDPATVRVGASSHDLNFSVVDGNVLRFEFPNIYLPDSNINQTASSGFLKFQVSQKKDLPDGARIDNSAAIYFDLNDPVITNTVFHTIGDHFLGMVATNSPDNIGVNVMPNPAREFALFQFDHHWNNASFVLQNQVGQVVKTDRFSGERYRLERCNLQSGVYLFRIHDPNGKSLSGKILIH